MTAYVLTGNCNIRQLGTLSPSGSATARAGGDTIDTSGFNFTIDQDTRYGLTGTTSTSFGNMTINATKGGNINIDGRYVRLIPFTAGSGTITAGTTITVGSSTAVVIGLYSAINAAPVLTGVAAGWIKVTGWNSVAFPTSGTFTQAGFTFTISGADKAGWIEVVGDDAAGVIANRLGACNITGEWFEVGTTTGLSTSTYQLPTNGSILYYSGVFIETSVGSGIFEPYPSAGSLVAAASMPTDAVRGKVCWPSTAGLLRLGSDGTNTVGYVPPSGLRIVVPNVLLVNCTTAARTANVLPNATLATRYDFTTTGGGVVNISKAQMNWYPSFAQAFSVSLVDVLIADQLQISECASPIFPARVCVGQTAAQAQFALLMSLCFAGGNFTDCKWTTASLAASGRYVNSLTDIAGFDFINDYSSSFLFRTNATSGNSLLTRVANCNWVNPVIGLGTHSMVTCSNINYTNTVYFDAITTTGTTMPMSAWTMASSCNNITINGLTFGGLTNVQPYTALLSIGAAGCSNIKLRNIGSAASPLSLGATNGTGLIYVLAAGAAASDVKIQRVYCSNTRTGIMTGDNSSTRVTEENVFGDYADAADVAAALNFKRKGIMGTLAVTAQTAVYGTHWYDCFTSTTAGRLGLYMNETTTLTASVVTLANGAGFTSAGGLYMPTIGQSATFELPYYCIGHTGFSATAGTMAGGTVANYNFNYSIDKNDGAGWSTMTTANYTAATLATAMNAITGIDASKGFRVRLKITTVTVNTTAITSFYMLTVSTTTAQAYQYPLDSNTVTFTGLPVGCDAVVLTAGTSTILDSKDAMAGTTYGYTYSGSQAIDIGFIKPGYVPFYIRNLSLTAADSSIPVSLTVDRNYA